FPLSDENPTLRTPIMTYAILAGMIGTWVLVQGAGFDLDALETSVCNLGLVPGEITGQAEVGTGIRISADKACIVDNEPINKFTPITSMFLHGSWGHLLGNALFFWVFGNNVEDSMGRIRFLVFYLLCGLAATAAHVIVAPASPIPTVGASGAISGILGAYLLLYPRVLVRTFIPPFFLFNMRAWFMLGWWFLWQVIGGLPQLSPVSPEVSSGVAFWAHVGGFVAGFVLIKFFVDRDIVRRRSAVAGAREVWDPRFSR
ncbi:MAG: rhomboid family intramembrane serine protease, partial [Gemmatimonadaceae bacterium]